MIFQVLKNIFGGIGSGFFSVSPVVWILIGGVVCLVVGSAILKRVKSL